MKKTLTNKLAAGLVAGATLLGPISSNSAEANSNQRYVVQRINPDSPWDTLGESCEVKDIDSFLNKLGVCADYWNKKTDKILLTTGYGPSRTVVYVTNEDGKTDSITVSPGLGPKSPKPDFSDMTADMNVFPFFNGVLREINTIVGRDSISDESEIFTNFGRSPYPRRGSPRYEVSSWECNFYDGNYKKVEEEFPTYNVKEEVLETTKRFVRDYRRVEEAPKVCLDKFKGIINTAIGHINS